MNYVCCVKNEAYIHGPDAPATATAFADLTIGAVYKVLPTTLHERDMGLLRIVDNAGEDYLYPASYFQNLDENTVPAMWDSTPTALTIHLDACTKAILRAEALTAHTSMGALVRQWIKERLEL
jgi:hypothetical protein